MRSILLICVFICKGCYDGMGHIKQTQHGANGQKVIEMTAYTMAQMDGLNLNHPSALQIIGCGLFKTSYFDRVRHYGFKVHMKRYSVQIQIQTGLK